MSEIIVPDPDGISLDSLTLYAPAALSRSAWTGKRKIIGLPGIEFWRGKVTIDAICTEEEERPWRAFLFGLRGPLNWFRVMLPRNEHVGPRPVVGAGAGNGYALPLSGMQPNARILHAGQYMSVPLSSGYPRPVCLTADLRADNSGNATAAFEPALSEIPATGAIVETVRPFIRMSPTDAGLGFDTSNGVSGTSFTVRKRDEPS